MAKQKAVILGAGITGLCIAENLADNGYDVTVIEKTPKIGGMCSSFEYKDFILDYGPHKFYTQLPGVYDEFKRIVGEGNYLIVPKKNSIRLLGRYFDFPIKMSQLMLRISPIVALQVMLDFAKSFLNKRKVISYEDYFINGFGKRGYELLFKGFAEKVWGDPKTLSEELARRRAPVSNIFDVIKTALVKNKKDVSADYFYYPKRGYGAICEALADKIIKKKGSILLSTMPNKIITSKGKITGVEISNGKSRRKLNCDVLVSSLAITELPNLITPAPKREIFEQTDKLKFRSLLIAYVFLKKERALKDNWIFFPEKEFCFNRVAEQKSFSPATGPNGKTVLTAEITCDFNDSTYNTPESEIKNKVISDLEKAGLIKENEVYDFLLKKAGRVYPVYSMNYKQALDQTLNYFDEFSNFYTVGRLGLFNYNNADHCIDMARVVSEIIKSKADRKKWKKARDYFNRYRIVD